VLFRSSDAEPWRVEGFHVNVVPKVDLAEPAALLARGSWQAWSFVGATMLCAYFALGTFWAALFWRGLKRRWLWLLVCAVGIVGVSLNLATGAFGVHLVFVQLFSASALWSGSAFDAWIVTASLPVGAIAFWLTRLRRAQPEAEV
jgi:hypothetical protein